MTEIFPNFIKTVNHQIHKAQHQTWETEKTIQRNTTTKQLKNDNRDYLKSSKVKRDFFLQTIVQQTTAQTSHMILWSLLEHSQLGHLHTVYRHFHTTPKSSSCNKDQMTHNPIKYLLSSPLRKSTWIPAPEEQRQEWMIEDHCQKPCRTEDNEKTSLKYW